ncbi:MAG: hypothetical protein QS748_06525 [Candidatus Endonucleobacter bathymodioli]|uniref:Uncharacterized protein n=1 Tax=Candidatus Endonucleibacter bathymodioli TaxID=539814 RepID=A0AA90NLI0_9GAMM|nr:hypothetical protein [Candidatus Endonucleobacter bathymodioli]
MENSLAILITLSILISGSSMASLDEMFGKFSEIKSYNEESNLCDYFSIYSHLDEIIVNNKAMPKDWLSRLSYEHNSQLKQIVEMMGEQELRDYLCQFNGDGQVVGKLLNLKNHEDYHYILFYAVMGLRCNYSISECDMPCSVIDKDVIELRVCENIIQSKIKQLTLGKRYFEERPYFVSKCSNVSNIKIGVREEKSGSERLQARHSNERDTDTVCDNSVYPSVLLYMSKGRKCCLNRKAYRNSELVACCNLAAWWLCLEAFKYNAVASKEDISRCQNIPVNSEIIKCLYWNGCPSEGIYFDINQVHEAITILQ